MSGGSDSYYEYCHSLLSDIAYFKSTIPVGASMISYACQYLEAWMIASFVVFLAILYVALYKLTWRLNDKDFGSGVPYSSIYKLICTRCLKNMSQDMTPGGAT